MQIALLIFVPRGTLPGPLRLVRSRGEGLDGPIPDNDKPPSTTNLIVRTAWTITQPLDYHWLGGHFTERPTRTVVIEPHERRPTTSHALSSKLAHPIQPMDYRAFTRLGPIQFKKGCRWDRAPYPYVGGWRYGARG